MSTSQNVYNVIWVDDEVDILYPDSKNIFRGEGVNIIGIAHTSLEFREIMEICYDRVDAVITDANFNNGKIRRDIEKDLSGLMDVRTCIEKYNERRDIPFYLYTGRMDLLESKREDGELEYFERNDRIYSKGDLKDLLQQIKQDIDHINSPSHQIRKRYAKELAAAERIKENEEFIFDALLKDYSGELENIENFYNPIRKTVERIVHGCNTLKILPDIPELNKVSDFLLHKKGVYELDPDVEIMPMPLIRGLQYVLDLTQDGSHDGTASLNLKVSDFVNKTKDVNLFRSLLLIAMDLCIWFDIYSRQHPDEERNALDWRFGQKGFCCEGKVVEVDGHLLCQRYELAKTKDSKYVAGDTVRIIEYIENRHPFDYTLFDQRIHVDRFVHVNKVFVDK